MNISRSRVLVLALASVTGLLLYFSAGHIESALMKIKTQNFFADDASQSPAELWQPLSSAQDRFHTNLSLATLQVNEQILITLPSGNSYPLRLDRRSKGQDVEQLYATVDPDGQSGFALLTIGAERVYGTLNTPEGVYELLGTQTNFLLKRSIDIDLDRQKGLDYKVRERSEEAIIRSANNKRSQVP